MNSILNSIIKGGSLLPGINLDDDDNDMIFLKKLGFDDGDIEMLDHMSLNREVIVNEYINTSHHDYNLTLPDIEDVAEASELSIIFPGTPVTKRDVAQATIHNLLEQNENQNQRGGIILADKNNKANFYNFIQNSDVKYFNKGSNGVIFTCKINIRSYKSQYKHVDSNKFGQTVKKLIVKITLINEFSEADYDPDVLEDLTDFEKKPEEAFQNEVNIQTEIFLKTMNYLQPLCPAIVYAGILQDKGDKETFFDILKGRMGQPSIEICNEILGSEIVKDPAYKIGIIGMEYAETYMPLYKYLNVSMNPPTTDREKKCYIYFGLFIILKLALDTGYTQADFHTGNIMIDKQNQYFKNSGTYICYGSPLILDFGYAKKIPEETMEKIRKLCSEDKYLQALKEICTVERADDVIVNHEKYAEYYGWVNGTFDLLTNREPSSSYGIIYLNNEHLKLLFKLRDDYIKQLVEEFNKLHEDEPEYYPTLPLTKEWEERMYPGLEGENTDSK